MIRTQMLPELLFITAPKEKDPKCPLAEELAEQVVCAAAQGERGVMS